MIKYRQIMKEELMKKFGKSSIFIITHWNGWFLNGKVPWSFRELIVLIGLQEDYMKEPIIFLQNICVNNIILDCK